MTTFSVIVPVYKAAHTLKRCVESLVASGGQDLQIILIEDHSPDDSWLICQRLAEQYSNVVCRRNDRNRGVSYTRNQGLDLVEGKYLLFTDSDDWVDPDYVAAFRSAIAAGNSFAVCGYVNHDEKQNGRTDIIGWKDFQGNRIVPLKEEIKKLQEERLLQQLWNKVFVTELVHRHKVRFDESISIGEDTRFILDYIQRSSMQEVCLINRPLYHYMRDQDGSLMFRVGYESVEEPLKNLRKLYEIMEIPDIEERLGQERQKTLENYAYLIMHNAGMPMKEKKRLILALDPNQGKRLYKSNRLLYFKEQLVRRLR
jgi:glycosyltransferase involved in cell wall biosynthesis